MMRHPAYMASQSPQNSTIPAPLPQAPAAPPSGHRSTRSTSRSISHTRRRGESATTHDDLGGTLQLVQVTGADIENAENDDSDEEEQASSGAKKRKKKYAAQRRQIRIEYINDKSRRNITFTKRKNGIIKKAHEISILTGCEVLLLVASRDTDQVFTFTTTKLQPLTSDPAGRANIQNCLRYGSMQQQESSTTAIASPPDRSAFLPGAPSNSGSSATGTAAARMPIVPAIPFPADATTANYLHSPGRRYATIDPFKRDPSDTSRLSWDDPTGATAAIAAPAAASGFGGGGTGNAAGGSDASTGSWRPSPLGPGHARSPVLPHNSLRAAASSAATGPFGGYPAHHVHHPYAAAGTTGYANSPSHSGGSTAWATHAMGNAGPMTRSHSSATAHSPTTLPTASTTATGSDYLVPQSAYQHRKSSEGDVGASLHAYSSDDPTSGAYDLAPTQPHHHSQHAATTRFSSSSEGDRGVRSSSIGVGGATTLAGASTTGRGGATTTITPGTGAYGDTSAFDTAASVGGEFDGTPYLEPGGLPDSSRNEVTGAGYGAPSGHWNGTN